MNRYTVLLLRPDYVANTFGQDTYMTHIEAENIAAAQIAAQEEAVFADRADDYDNIHPDDYAVLMVVEGHHLDKKEIE